MANLFWKTAGKTRALLDKPFKTEEEFEKTVFGTAELLKDIFLLKRQVRGGNKAGFFNAFGLSWWGTKSFGFFAKISQADAKRLKPGADDYSVRWKEAHYRIEPGKTKVKDFLPIFDFAYKKLAGGDEE